MTKAAIVGAGKTGRGFLARLLKESGAEIAFIDKNEELVKQLNEKKSFNISFFTDREDMLISDYTAYTGKCGHFGL